MVLGGSCPPEKVGHRAGYCVVFYPPEKVGVRPRFSSRLTSRISHHTSHLHTIIHWHTRQHIKRGGDERTSVGPRRL
eukprot:scaffold96441_cov57-Phaeocystis_antarctica.AAC.3